ncbi:MAG TPA: hypothetical protein PKA38_03790 [Candidatus Levybacteria bacterium]|nr:hypothetical protein [Candidatus Levybacteria bacterium]
MPINHESHEIFAQYGISEDTLYPKVKLFTSPYKSTGVDRIMETINLQEKVYGEDADVNISRFNRFSTSIPRRMIDGDILVETFGNNDAGMEYAKSNVPSGFMVEVFTGGYWNIKVAAEMGKDSERYLLRQLQHFGLKNQESLDQLANVWPILTITNDGKLELSSEGAFTMSLRKAEVETSSTEVKWRKYGAYFLLDDICPSLLPNQDIEAEVGVCIRNFDISEMINTLGKGVRQKDLTMGALNNYVKPYILLQEQTKV